MKHLFTAALAALVLSIAAPASAASFDLNGLLAATANDLAAADADAIAHHDVFASQCYEGVAAFVTANPLNLTLPNVVGVASAFQVARDGVKAAQSVKATGLLPPALVQACGPLALDVQNDLGKAANTGLLSFLHL
jgi:hypothetical protein